MIELDILIKGIIAYGFLMTGYALWLEVDGFKILKSIPARKAKIRASLAVSVQHTSPVDKVA